MRKNFCLKKKIGRYLHEHLLSSADSRKQMNEKKMPTQKKIGFDKTDNNKCDL